MKEMKNWFLPKLAIPRKRKIFAFHVDIVKGEKKFQNVYSSRFIYGSVCYRDKDGTLKTIGFDSRLDMCNWIFSVSKSGYIGVCYLLDLVASTLFKEKEWNVSRFSYGSKKDLKYIKRSLKKELTDEGAIKRSSNLVLIDSMNHFSGNIREMAFLLGKKFENDCFDFYATKELKSISKFKSEIIFQFFENMQEMYLGLGCQMRNTLASTAMDLYQRKYLLIPWSYRCLKGKLLEDYSKSYYGGRIENFKQGHFDRFYICDFNSFYGSVMKEIKLPLLSSDLKISRSIPGKGDGIAMVQIKSPDCEYPVLPYKSEKMRKTFYPVGIWTGYYTLPEIRYFLETGGKIKKVIKCWEYGDSDFVFAEYVSDLYQKRISSFCKFEKEVLKNLMNSLYGKFAEGGRMEEITCIDKVQDDPEYKPWYGYAKKEEIGEPANYVNNIWSAIITSQARIKLHKSIIKYNAFYCYTDSIFSKSEIIKTNQLGELSLKMIAEKGIIAGVGRAKIWEEGSGKVDLKLATIPKTKNSDLVQDHSFWEIEGFKKSAISGREPASLIRFEKSLKPQYSKRCFDSSGNSRPWCVEEIEEGKAKDYTGIEFNKLVKKGKIVTDKVVISDEIVSDLE